MELYNHSKTIISNELHTIKMEDGIIIGTYHPELKRITLEIAKQLVKERLELCNGKTYPILGDPSRAIVMDDDARLYFTGKEASMLVSAFALVTRNPIQRLVGNFFLKIKPLPYPAKLFVKKERAIHWLKQFRHLN